MPCTVKMVTNEEMKENVLDTKWLNINEDVAYKRIINCTNFANQRYIGNCLCKIM
jgi:hypothetical protein